MNTIELLVGMIVGVVAGAGVFYLATYAALRDTRSRWIARLEDHRAEILALIQRAELAHWGTAAAVLYRQLDRINNDLKKARRL